MKDKQEINCFHNLLSGQGGKYVRNKLRFLKTATVIEDWEESPDFLVKNARKVYGFEHFLIDQTYVENRSGSRVIDDDMWATYKKYHEMLEKGIFDACDAGEAVQNALQNAFDIANLFDYRTCMKHFDRVFDNHVNKIPRYLNNLSSYPEKELFFVIEMISLFISDHNRAIPCVARRNDDAAVYVGGNHIVFTKHMIKKIEEQIGVLKGVIVQNYSYFDLGKEIKDMVYLDTSSKEAFENSIKEQKIQIYKEYDLDIPRVCTRLNIVK